MSATAHLFGEQKAVAARTRDGGVGPASTAPTNVLVVPKEAIQTIDGQPFVFLEKGAGKFNLRAIVRGEEVDGEVEITRGLTAEETIAVDGTFVLKSEALRAQMGSND